MSFLTTKKFLEAEEILQDPAFRELIEMGYPPMEFGPDDVMNTGILDFPDDCISEIFEYKHFIRRLNRMIDSFKQTDKPLSTDQKILIWLRDSVSNELDMMEKKLNWVFNNGPKPEPQPRYRWWKDVA
jgi:hypothetical protein